MWYEILIVIVSIPVGAYIVGKVYEQKKNMYHNDSWKNRNK